MILAFAGRRPSDAPGAQFSPDAVQTVARRIDRVVADLAPRTAVGPAAAGADLLVAGAVRRAGATVAILLPVEVEQFVSESVADRGEDWVHRFHELTAGSGATVEVVAAPGSANDRYRAVNEAIIRRARELAEPGEAVVALAVWSGPRSGDDLTADFVDRATRAGLRLVEVDPGLD